MSAADLLLSILAGCAGAAIGVMCFSGRWARLSAAVGGAVGIAVGLTLVGLITPADPGVVPGRGVVTIAPPGPCGGVTL